MKNKTSKIIQMPEICGVLPPNLPQDLIIMFCINGNDELKCNTLLQRLNYLLKQKKELHFHTHILNDNYNLKEKLMILDRSENNKLTITDETFDPIDTLPPNELLRMISFIRLYNIIMLIKRPILLTNPLDPLSDTKDIKKIISEYPILIGKKYLQKIAVDGGKKSQSFLNSISKQFLYSFNNQKKENKKNVQQTISYIVNRTSQINSNIIRYLEEDNLENKRNIIKTDKNIYLSNFWPKTNKSKILLLKPEMALPFKSPLLVSHHSSYRKNSPFLKGKDGELRAAWHKCYELIENALKSNGYASITINRPGREINSQLANLTKPDLVISPHRQNFQFEGVQVPCLYLMQIAHRWLFTLDEKGWGAGAAYYPYNNFHNSPDDSGVFERYRKLTITNNESKFLQKSRKSRQELINEGIIPESPFLFFPCQIPNDEVIKFFCKISEEEIITRISRWANKNKIYMIFNLIFFSLKSSFIIITRFI